jgi:hypothetical protein
MLYIGRTRFHFTQLLNFDKPCFLLYKGKIAHFDLHPSFFFLERVPTFCCFLLNDPKNQNLPMPRK